MSTSTTARAWVAQLHEAEAVADLLVAFRDHQDLSWPSENAFLAIGRAAAREPRDGVPARGARRRLGAGGGPAAALSPQRLEGRARRLAGGPLRLRGRPPRGPRRRARHARVSSARSRAAPSASSSTATRRTRPRSRSTSATASRRARRAARGATCSSGAAWAERVLVEVAAVRRVPRAYGRRPPSRSELASAPPSSSSAAPAKAVVISRFSGFVPICEPSRS